MAGCAGVLLRRRKRKRLVIPVKVDPKLGGPSVQVQMVYSYVFHESFYLYVV